MNPPGRVRPQRPPELPTDLAEMRTIMAADRTLMAWVRTALAMLSFSFAIYRFLEAFQAEKLVAHPNAPQRIGEFLAGMGTAAIIAGTLEYWTTLKDISRTERVRLGRPVFYMAVVLAIAGAVLFVCILLKLF
jgi:inner membrane protein YidH